MKYDNRFVIAQTVFKGKRGRNGAKHNFEILKYHQKIVLSKNRRYNEEPMYIKDQVTHI